MQDSTVTTCYLVVTVWSLTNVLALHSAQLVLGWVTVHRYTNTSCTTLATSCINSFLIGIQWYSSSQNHFSFSFYKVWAHSFQYKFLYSIWIIFRSGFYKVFLEIISVQFQYLHHPPLPMGLGEELSEFFWIFCLEMVHFVCILTHDYTVQKISGKGKQIISVSVFKVISITVSVSFFTLSLL